MSEEYSSAIEEPVISENDETDNISDAESPDAKENKKTKFRVYTPVIISAVFLLITVFVFSGWKLFFDRSLTGSWVMKFNSNGRDYTVNMSFEKDNVCYLRLGGLTFKGSYSLEEDEKGHQMLKTTFTRSGQTYKVANFRYSVSGSELTGKTLSLTDLSGFRHSPDVIASQDDEKVREKMNTSDYIEEDGIRYYIIEFNNKNSYSNPVVHYNIENTDSKLTGIWLYTSDNSNNDHTFAFYDDNTYQITYRDYECLGCYTAGNGSCVFNIANADGSIDGNSSELKYSFEDDKLIVTIIDEDGKEITYPLTRTDNEYAFDNGIK